MREDRLVGVAFVGVLGFLVLLVAAAWVDVVQGIRAERRSFECARSGMASVRHTFTTEVVCVPYVIVARRGR